MPLAMRVIPSLISATLQLMRRPKRFSASRRCVNLQSVNPPSRLLIEMDDGQQERVLLAVAKRVLGLTEARERITKQP
jgi:hypothetical protein